MSDRTKCANCGNSVSTRGPAPPENRRFCMKRECRSAKQREYLERLRATERFEDAPTNCTSCGIELAARKKRHGDSPLGRWCTKAACLRHRRATEDSAGLRQLQESEKSAATDRSFLLSWVLGATVECEDCGRQCVVGFTHPAIGVKVPCHGLGSRIITREVVDAAWPGWLQAYDA